MTDIPKFCEQCPHVQADRTGWRSCRDSEDAPEGTDSLYVPGPGCVYRKIRRLENEKEGAPA